MSGSPLTDEAFGQLDDWNVIMSSVVSISDAACMPAYKISLNVMCRSNAMIIESNMFSLLEISLEIQQGSNEISNGERLAA